MQRVLFVLSNENHANMFIPVIKLVNAHFSCDATAIILDLYYKRSTLDVIKNAKVPYCWLNKCSDLCLPALS